MRTKARSDCFERFELSERKRLNESFKSQRSQKGMSIGWARCQIISKLNRTSEIRRIKYVEKDRADKKMKLGNFENQRGIGSQAKVTRKGVMKEKEANGIEKRENLVNSRVEVDWKE